MNTEFIINKPFAKGNKIPVQLFLDCLVSFPMYIRQVSSAYNNNSELTECGMSFRCKRKEEDPKLSLDECHKTT